MSGYGNETVYKLCIIYSADGNWDAHFGCVYTAIAI